MAERKSLPSGVRGTWARGAWLATTIALGIALVGSSLANFRGAQAAFETLTRGQLEMLEHVIRDVNRPGGIESDTAAIAAVLESQSAAGLRYIALLEADGTVLASAGEPAEPLDPNRPPLQEMARQSETNMARVQGRIRVFLPRLVRLPRDLEDRRGDRGRDSQPAFGFTLVEFEPIAASQLLAQSGRSLALGSVAAALLTLASILFWRQSALHEAAQREVEQRRRLSQLGEMAAVLAHEIRNPLASLKGNAQLLAERLPEGSRDHTKAALVVAEAMRLETLTSDLLEFARSGPIELRPLDPTELVERAIVEVGAGEFKLDATDAPALWQIDAVRLRHALVNILRNAQQASPEGTKPIVRIAGGDEDLVIEVRDFGLGLPGEIAERIFEPFVTNRTNGTGLGLSVALRAAEFHGGTVTAENHPDGGAVFRILLPRPNR